MCSSLRTFNVQFCLLPQLPIVFSYLLLYFISPFCRDSFTCLFWKTTEMLLSFKLNIINTEFYCFVFLLHIKQITLFLEFFNPSILKTLPTIYCPLLIAKYSHYDEHFFNGTPIWILRAYEILGDLPLWEKV